MINLPNDVKYIIEKLEKAGYEAFIIGGCVRDYLLNVTPKDWDISTSAKPQEVKKVFANDTIIPTGEKYGTLTIVLNKVCYEITTYRSDGDYKDGRRPEMVKFSKTLREDVDRRDFTINSLAYNYNTGLIDYKNGKNDIENKIIRAVGDPYERFSEDALRIMRCFRFAFKYDFSIEEETLAAAYKLKHKLGLISKERIREELVKIINFASYEQLQQFKPILIEIINEFEACNNCEQNDKYHCHNVLDHSLMAVYLADDIDIKLALLFHDIGKPLCKIKDHYEISFPNHANVSCDISLKILKELKFSNKDIKKICTLIKYHTEKFEESEYYVRKLVNKIGKSLTEKLFDIRYCDIYSQKDHNREKRLLKVDLMRNIYSTILEKDQFYNIKKLAVNGNDLIELGFESNKIGETLNECLDMVMKSPSLNNKKYLLLYLKYKKG